MKINKTSGFMMVTTVFIVVILSLIATFIVQTSMLTSQAENLDVLQTRAYYAAKSGIEWLNYQLGPLHFGSGGTPACPASPTTMTITQGGLKGFRVVVTCSASANFTEGATSYKIFTGAAVATLGTTASSSINYVTQTVNQIAAGFNAP